MIVSWHHSAAVSAPLPQQGTKLRVLEEEPRRIRGGAEDNIVTITGQEEACNAIVAFVDGVLVPE